MVCGLTFLCFCSETPSGVLEGSFYSFCLPSSLIGDALKACRLARLAALLL